MDNNKITEFSKKKIKNLSGKKLLNKEGFAYVTMEQDINGFNFNPDHLKKYALSNKYTITIARKIENKTVLNNYFINNDELANFFRVYSEGKIEGDLIEIDKFNPEILA